MTQRGPTLEDILKDLIAQLALEGVEPWIRSQQKRAWK